ncbi:PKD domain-containing protein [Parvicella tangerina]|uniref:PKD domain-containing protein n=1 Tax=Parvicella tangerina TaxID=2829795 RepID=A0A916JKA7_9FLAO|nr:PKD domain-containing protein [Parvicella tangerina]CAG5077378.1 hypothetical protein CRYO30217_00365 [Parvicella tangerina]
MTLKTLITALLLCIVSTSFSATFYVNDNDQTFDLYCSAVGNNSNTGLTPADPFETLAQAISLASAGDLILVDAGTYTDMNISLTPTLNNLTIRGASVSTTIFEGTTGSGIFNFMSISGSNITLENLTIQFFDNAGAIDIISGSVTDSTFVTLNDCFFYQNETYTSFDTNPSGGAIFITTGAGNLPSVVNINNCQFGDNLAEQGNGGGAIYADGRSRLHIYGSRFTCNNSRAILTTYEGGAIMFNSAYGVIDSCYISGSPVFDQQGGGFRAINGTARLDIDILNTIFTGNTGRQGAAFYIEDNYDCSVVNSLIYGNTVTGGFGDGGSVSCDGAVNMNVMNSTIADNLSTHSSDGGGLAADGAASFTVQNSIIWNNQVNNIRSAAITATYSNIEPVNTAHSGTTGNIAVNPLFLGAGDYTLQGTSPCINTGDLTGAPSSDLTNNARVGNPDMGAFENGSSYPSTSDLCTLVIPCTPPSSIALTADDLNICEGTSTNINIAGSETGVSYQLINDNTSSNVGTPVSGTGGTISISTGNLTTTTDFSVLAYVTGNPSCNTPLSPLTITVASNPTVTISSTSECEDGAITLTPNSGGSWVSNNTSVATVTSGGVVTIVADGTVDFTFTESVANCQATTNSVTIHPLPTVSVSNNVICENEVLTLTPTTGGTWASNNTSVATVTAGGTVTIIANGNVDFTFTESVNSCQATTSSVTVNPVPSATASNNGPICEGESLSLLGGNNGLNYSWTGPNGFSSTSQNPTVNLNATSLMSGNYDLVVTDGTCSNTASTSVVINTPPSIDVSSITINDPTVCGATDGEILGITATGTPSLSYSWNGGASQSTPDLTSSGAGSYSLTVTDGNGCSASEGPFILSDPSSPAQPSISLNPSAVCIGGEFTISVDSPDPAATYSWNGPNGFSSTGTSINLANISINDAGNYTVTPTVAGCTGSTSNPANVTVNNLPVVDILSPQNVTCNNPTVTLDGSNSESGASISYNWTTTNGNFITSPSSNTVDVDLDGDYRLIVTNSATGCVDSLDVVVGIDTTSPTASTGGDLISDCSNNNLPINLDGSSSSSGANISYNWVASNGGNIISGGTTNSPIVDMAGTYELTVTNTDNGCSSTSSMDLTMDTLSPIASDANNSMTSIMCSTFFAATLDGSASSSGNGETYSWSTTNGTIDFQNGTQATVVAEGDYTLTVTGTNGCTSSVTITVIMDTASPNINIPALDSLSCVNTTVTIDASGTTGSNVDYFWSTGETSPSITTDTAGVFTLTASSDNGCGSTVSIEVFESGDPSAAFIPSADSGQAILNVDFDNQSTGTGLTYVWNFGDGGSANTEFPSYSYTTAGEYDVELIATNNVGCADTAYATIIVTDNRPIVIPNVFTPNGDGENDLFAISGSFKNMHLVIYNRWGQVMTDLWGSKVKWDGRTMAGLEVPEGTYYYLIDIIDFDDETFEYTGPLLLNR